MSFPIPYGHQSISEEDIQAVTQVLSSDWLTQGPTIERFEQAIADYCRSQYAVAVSNGTVALHLACLGLNLSSGDWLWTSANSFVASANCALYCGARVDFVDIDPRTYNMDVDSLSEKLVSAKKQNKLPKIVIPVHFSGQSCDMRAIKALSNEYGFKIIADACHALGGQYLQSPVGMSNYADITVFSLHPVKTITTGEGGVIVADDKNIVEKIRRLRTHGITRDTNLFDQVSHGSWYYQQLELGYNYRLSDLQAALGISQLQRIDNFIAKRVLIAERYNQLFKYLPIQLPEIHSDCSSAWHLYVVLVQAARRKYIFDLLRAQKISVNVHYIPIHTQPYYQKLGFKEGDFPKAESYYSQTLSLPMYPDLQASQQEYVAEQFIKALS